MSCLFPITRLKTDKISRLGDIRKSLQKTLFQTIDRLKNIRMMKSFSQRLQEGWA